MQPTQRLHSLDNLRALMMWLGIVLHVALNHVTGEAPVPWRDPATSEVASFAMGFIHSFRMPVFFILAGFFAALLAGRRGFGGMLKHRLRRLGLPFVLFWPPLLIGIGLLATVYVHLMARGSLGFDPALLPQDPPQAPINTLHLWFIYYLLIFCVLAAIAGQVGQRLPEGFRAGVSAGWRKLAGSGWGVLVLALPLALAGAFHRGGIVIAGGAFVPQGSELLYNGMFFLCGWYLYAHRDSLLDHYVRRCWRYAAAGLPFFLVSSGLYENSLRVPGQIAHVEAVVAYLYGCANWLWSFALIGLFLRYLPRQNRVLSYLADSSYWVYLVHMLGTVGFGVLLFAAPLDALSKMAINIAATSLVCLASYQLFVRRTALGALLNGRRLASAPPAQPRELGSENNCS